MASNPQALVGHWIGNGYQVQRFIGAGAFAWVYYAVNTHGQPLAIKVLQAPSDEARTLFSREIKVLRQLPHSPYCVAYVDDGITDDGTPFLVMEFIDGCTLKDAFKFKPVWEVPEACHFMLQMCDALAGLHRLGLAHRDLKPENVMLTRDWQVKLMDFGLVKDAQGLLKLFESEDILSGRDFAENIDKAMLAGTPEYMAPEQFSDPMIEDETLAKTDTWSDVYSLGLIFYQLLVGEKLFPFPAPANDQRAYARAMLEYIKLRTGFADRNLVCPQQIPAALWPVIAVSLRQNPRHRQHHATELGDTIRRYLDTGSTDDFAEEEFTSMADMSSVLRGLRSQEPSHEDDDRTMVVNEVSEVTSVRGYGGGVDVPGAKRGGVGLGSTPAQPAPHAPPPSFHQPVDVAAVQAYRDQRLNRPGRPDFTIPPGAMQRSDVFPDGTPSYPSAISPSHEPNPPVVAAAVAVRPRRASGRRTGALVVAAVVALSVAASVTAFALLR